MRVCACVLRVCACVLHVCACVRARMHACACVCVCVSCPRCCKLLGLAPALHPSFLPPPLPGFPDAPLSPPASASAAAAGAYASTTAPMTLQWVVYSPEGTFDNVANATVYEQTILK